MATGTNIFELMQNMLHEPMEEDDDAPVSEYGDDKDEDYEPPSDFQLSDSEGEDGGDGKVGCEEHDNSSDEERDDSSDRQTDIQDEEPNQYTGKDGSIWKGTPVLPSSRTRSSNIVRVKPGPKCIHSQ